VEALLYCDAIFPHQTALQSDSNAPPVASSHAHLNENMKKDRHAQLKEYPNMTRCTKVHLGDKPCHRAKSHSEALKTMSSNVENHGQCTSESQE